MATKKKYGTSIIFILILAFVLTFILALLNDITKPVVEQNSQVDLQSKILYLFEIEAPDDSAEAISQTFEENFVTEDYKGQNLYVYQPENEPLGYAVPFVGPGLWGTIAGYVGVNADLTEITGLEFTEQSETPGLGGRIGEEPYKSQFRNLDISQVTDNNLLINRPAPGGNIDAISGATQTSAFVVQNVNSALGEFITERKGAN